MKSAASVWIAAALCLAAAGCAAAPETAVTEAPAVLPSPTPVPTASPAPEETAYKVKCGDGSTASVVVTAHPAERDGRTVYSFSYTLGQEKDGLELHFAIAEDTNTISVSDAEGTELQAIQVGVVSGGILNFEDFNADGCADLSIFMSGTMNEEHKLYLWSRDEGKFVELVTEVPLYYYEVYDGYVKNWVKDGMDRRIVQTLVWDGDDSLVLESEVDIVLETPKPDAPETGE